MEQRICAGEISRILYRALLTEWFLGIDKSTNCGKIRADKGYRYKTVAKDIS